MNISPSKVDAAHKLWVKHTAFFSVFSTIHVNKKWVLGLSSPLFLPSTTSSSEFPPTSRSRPIDILFHCQHSISRSLSSLRHCFIKTKWAPVTEAWRLYWALQQIDGASFVNSSRVLRTFHICHCRTSSFIPIHCVSKWITCFCPIYSNK